MLFVLFLNISPFAIKLMYTLYQFGTKHPVYWLLRSALQLPSVWLFHKTERQFIINSRYFSVNITKPKGVWNQSRANFICFNLVYINLIAGMPSFWDIFCTCFPAHRSPMRVKNPENTFAKFFCKIAEITLVQLLNFGDRIAYIYLFFKEIIWYETSFLRTFS